MDFLHVVELLLIGWCLYRIHELEMQLHSDSDEVETLEEWKPVDLTDEREFELEEQQKRRLMI